MNARPMVMEMMASVRYGLRDQTPSVVVQPQEPAGEVRCWLSAATTG